MGESSAPYRFGVKTSQSFSSFAVLDKSFLDGVNSAQLQYYAQKGWTFGVPEVLMYEHFRKRDARRIANLFKLHSVEKSLVMLPGIGEMFREEAKRLKPALAILRAKSVEFIVKRGPSGEFFELDADALRSTKERTADLEWRLGMLTATWRMFSSMPKLKDARPEEVRERADELSLQIRDDREDVRGFYANHRNLSFSPPELIDEHWAFFRWTQVQLLAGLDFFASYGVQKEPNREKLLHELLDLDYLIAALLVGGLACREKRFIGRFRLLRPDGVVLR